MTQFDLDDVVASETPRVKELRAALLRGSQPYDPSCNSYLVKGWLDAGAVSLVYAPSNAGKTFFVLDLCFHVAAGMPWMGNRVREGRVLYLVSEGATGFRGRMQAVEISRPELYAAGHKNLVSLPAQIDLRSHEDVRSIQTVVGHDRCDLLIVDTLAMAFGDGNENDAQDMTQFLKQVKTLAERLGCHVLLVHHPGKDATRGARGSSTLRAAVDTEIEIAIDNSTGIRTATITKQREGPTGLSVAFELERVTLGEDDDGDQATSCVVRQASYDGSVRRTPMTGHNQVAYQALQEIAGSSGTTSTQAEEQDPPPVVVTVQVWKDAFLQKLTHNGSKADSNIKAFKRAAHWLMDEGYVRIVGDHVWLVRA
jgi:hypothetical protein